MIWLRTGLLIALVAVVALALGTAGSPAPPQAQPVAVVIEPTLPPSPVPATAPTRLPLPTAEPQRIISRVARETPTPGPTATPSSEPAVAIVDNGYLPSQLVIQVGSRVRWTNLGSDGHDISGNGPGGSWRSGPIGPADRYERLFATAGTYTYVCSVHPEMRGRIDVQP
jgi:plastocyanin